MDIIKEPKKRGRMYKIIRFFHDMVLIEWLIIAVVVGIVSAIVFAPSRPRDPAYVSTTTTIKIYEVEYKGQTIPCATRGYDTLDCAWEMLDEN